MKIGALVRWREPLDADYMMGYVRAVKGKEATIECMNYYAGTYRTVAVSWLEDVHGRLENGSSKKRHTKRRSVKAKL
jgi:hypothetical protein